MKLLHDEKMAWYDWRNEDAYPPVENTSVEQWAWEFLRRNPAYIHDWNRYISDFICRKWGRLLSSSEMQDEGFEQEFNFLQMTLQLDDDKDLDVYEPPLMEGETEEGWRARTTSDGRKFPLHRKYGHKWGLLLIIDPAADDGHWFFGTTQPLIRHNTTKDGRWLSHGARGGFAPLSTQIQCKVEVTINLEVSLEGQLRFLREVLEQEKKSLLRRNLLAKAEGVRLRVDQYQSHLRLLDADAIGIGVREAGEVLYPYSSDGIDYDDGRTKRVRAQLKAAEELRDGGYRQLLGEDWRAAGKGKNSD